MDFYYCKLPEILHGTPPKGVLNEKGGRTL